MKITSARYSDAENSTIDVVADEKQLSIPDDMDNRHRMAIAEWEAQGNTIDLYVSPPTKTDAQVDAEMDTFMDSAFMKSVIEGVADVLPGSTSASAIRDAIKAHGRKNIPR